QPAPAIYPSAAVAADHPLASQAGVEILRAGGNAVDAAVATSFALSVTRPFSCGIGGGGFMVIYLPDDPTHGRVVTAINYRETAPRAIMPNTFASLPAAASRKGGLAVAVPGTVAGLLHALERYGTMDRAAVLAPAIQLARWGYPLDTAHKDANTRIAANSSPPCVADQADALRRIAALGRDGFYRGPVARAIVNATHPETHPETHHKNNHANTASKRGAGGSRAGVITMEDLRRYRVRETPPLRSDFKDLAILGMPPPSSGGVAIAQVLGFLDHLSPERSPGQSPFDGPESAHALVEAIKFAFADRAQFLGDPAFSDVPTELLLSEGRIAGMTGRFNPSATLGTDAYGDTAPPAQDGGTSHLSVVDRWGGAVACTETINTTYGSGVVVEPFGFVLNNEMDDFTTKPGEPNAYGLMQSGKNLPARGKRPLSSMSPMIVLDENGSVEIVAGASGGPRIITGTLQAVLRVVYEDADAQTAVDAPRLHHQWLPDVLTIEPGLGGLSLAEGLRARGHATREAGSGSVVQLIRRVEGGWSAGSDRRKGGRPAGY
ncbi:MAG: gamma-glutamyltransferase family protein, partial [Planctomycetota bacterium]